ncbi:MAG: hypothetical protein JOZ84_00605 [Methylobacteriaceae bacterium]|nr:hypothetical protein [Methylobacteriaceae bacterium]
MSMKAAIAAGAILLASGMAVSAQTSSSAPTAGRSATSPNTPAGSSAQDQNSEANEPLRQQVRDNLTKAGFTDIRIMPTSFMIRAKDQSGNPVMMVINPDSFTEVTAVSPNNNNNDKNGAPNNSNSAAGQKH